MDQPISRKPLKNYAEAAAWLGVSTKWLQRRVQSGAIPHARFGKYVRFSQEHLDAIVAAGEPKPSMVAAPTAVRRSGVIGRPRTIGRRP